MNLNDTSFLKKNKNLTAFIFTPLISLYQYDSHLLPSYFVFFTLLLFPLLHKAQSFLKWIKNKKKYKSGGCLDATVSASVPLQLSPLPYRTDPRIFISWIPLQSNELFTVVISYSTQSKISLPNINLNCHNGSVIIKHEIYIFLLSIVFLRKFFTNRNLET